MFRIKSKHEAGPIPAISQHSTHYLCLVSSPIVVTDGAPDSAMKDLDSTFVSMGTTKQTDICWTRSRNRWAGGSWTCTSEDRIILNKERIYYCLSQNLVVVIYQYFLISIFIKDTHVYALFSNLHSSTRMTKLSIYNFETPLLFRLVERRCLKYRVCFTVIFENAMEVLVLTCRW